MKSVVIVTSTKLKIPLLYVYFVTMSFESKRGRKKMAIDGFLYVFDKYSSDKVTTFWRCERKNDGCYSSTAHTYMVMIQISKSTSSWCLLGNAN